jgi:hypothetical protein
VEDLEGKRMLEILEKLVETPGNPWKNGFE